MKTSDRTHSEIIKYRFCRIGLYCLFAILLLSPVSAFASARLTNHSVANAWLASDTLKTIIIDNYYPYTFVNAQGQPDGFSVDLMRAVAQVMGAQVEIRVDTWDHALVALQNGEIDFLPMMAYSTERDKAFDFSAPHTIAYDAFFTRKNASTIRSTDDLRGKKIIVMKGDQAHDYLRSLAFLNADQFILVESLPQALRLLASGTGDTALMPKLVGMLSIRDLNLTNLEPSPVVVEAYNRPFSFAIRDGNQALLERLSQGLSIVKATGQYRDIYNQWFAAVEPEELSWATVLPYVSIIVLVLVFTGALLLLWSFSLRRQVAVRTRLLEIEIQEHKQAEEKLREREKLLRTIADNYPRSYLSIIERDLTVGFTAGQEFQKLNLDPQKFVGLTLEQVFGDQTAVVREYYQKTFAGEEQSFELVINQQHQLYRTVPLHDEAGNIPRILSVVENITERKRSEAALRIKDSALESSINAIAISDLQGNLTYVNPMFVNLWGYTDASQVLGRNATTFWQMQDRAAEVMAALQTKGGWIGELIAQRQEGATFVAQVSTSMIRDSGGQPLAMFAAFTDITQRKQTEEALRLHAERLGLALDAAHAGTWEWDLRTNENIWSAELWKVYGLEPHSCVPSYEAWRQIIHPDDRAKVEQTVQQVVRDEAVLNFEWRTCDRDGTERTLMSRGRPIRGAHGQVEKYIGIVLDITERKRVELAARESEERLRMALENSGVILFNQDRELRYTWIYNPHPAFKPETVLEKTDAELLAPEDAMGLQTIKRRVIETGVSCHEDVRTSIGGEPHYYTLTVEPLRDVAQQIVGVRCVSVDITERKRIEEKIQQSRDQLLKFAAQVPGMLYQFERLTDGSFRVPFTTEAIRDIFGCSPEEVREDFAPIAQVIHPDDLPRVNADIEASYRDLTPFQCEYRVLLPNKPVHWVMAQSMPERMANGTTIWNGYNTDITGRKQAEAEIRKLNAELEQRVIRRTAQLEAANQELEAFAYSVSHDLRAPLRGIDGWSQALLEDYGKQLDNQAQTYLDRVRSETQRMGQLIDDLLQLSRLTRDEIRTEPVNLSAMAKAIAVRLQAQTPERAVEFTIQPGLGALGDPRLLEIALSNLLGNAFKFTGKTLQAHIEFGQTGWQGHPAFFVRDNGAGFDMAYAQKLFGAFQRAHKASEFPGTGIGLATVQRIMHRHGGRVWAQAQVNQGATFYFTLEEER